MKNKFLKGGKAKGFTVIEIIIVVVIISLMTSIVVAFLGSSRNKGNDIAAKESTVSLRSMSELYYVDSGNSYTGFCADVNTTEAIRFATTTTGLSGDCDVAADGQSWAAEVDLILEGYFCIDTGGGGRVRASSKGATATVCPVI